MARRIDRRRGEPVSNRRRGTRKPPPEAIAYAAAYRCGHCTGRARARRKPDELGVWHIEVAHDDSCPAYAGTVPLTGAGLRALEATVKATGTSCLYIPLTPKE